MENDNLALELLTQMKTTIKRLFVVVLLLTFLLFATNIAWLYYWNIPSEKCDTTISQDSGEQGVNNYIGNDGDINGSTSDN